MEFIDAVRILRKELLIKDEPLKAYQMLKELNLSELQSELDRSYALVRHVFEPKVYEKFQGDDPILDCEQIEPRHFILNAGERYPRYQWVLDEVGREKPESYLDFACYVGSLVTSVANKGVRAYGVDLTKKAIEVARERAKSVNLSHLATFYVGNIEDFNEVKADLISAFEVIEHVADPIRTINHLCELANKWVYITTPDGPFGNGEGNLGHWDWDGVDIHIRGHVRVFTRKTMEKLLKDCGCEIGLMETRGGIIYTKFRKAR